MKYWNENLKNLKPYIPGEYPKNIDKVAKLNANENPFPPSPKVKKALKNLDVNNLRIYSDPNATDLCETIAKKYKVKRKQVIATNGSDEALSYIFASFTSESSKIVMFNPTYTVYESLAERYGLSYEYIESEDNFELDLGKVSNEENVVLFLANPNAQTGTYISVKNIEKFLKKFKGLLILDEAYSDFAGDTAARLSKKYDNIIIVRTLSKSFSLCGIRLGYAIGSQDLISGLYRIKDSYNVNTITQTIGIKALKDSAYTNKNVKKITKERVKLESVLKELGFSIIPSSANFILAKPPAKTQAESLYKKLKAKDIFIRYFNTQRLREYVRITIGTPKQNIKLKKNISRIIEN